MSDMNLKVTPAELEAKAADFKSVMTQTKSLTDDMMNDVTGLSSSWTGDASASYINKFRKLQTDMDTMGRMINEHVNNLLKNIRQQRKRMQRQRNRLQQILFRRKEVPSLIAIRDGILRLRRLL